MTDTEVSRHAQINNRALDGAEADFGDARAEALSLRGKVAVVSRTDLALIEIGGKDRRAWLQRLVSADLKNLVAGQGTPAALLTAKGRVIAHFGTLISDTHISLVVDRFNADTLVAALERLAVFDEVEISANPMAFLGVYGPELAGLQPFADETLEAYNHVSRKLFDVDVTIVGDDSLATAGRLLFAAVSDADMLRGALLDAGVPPAGLAAYETCRVEAGCPRAGAELTDGVMLLEAGQLGAVSFNKGCYIGQEPVCRVHSRGQVNYRLSGLRFSGEQAASAGQKLLAAEDAEAGSLTSVAYSPSLQANIALGYLHRKHSDVGTVLRTDAGAELRVVSLPHVDGVPPLTCPRFKE
jgi:tRNA-modifying protein YgfZ